MSFLLHHFGVASRPTLVPFLSVYVSSIPEAPLFKKSDQSCGVEI